MSPTYVILLYTNGTVVPRVDSFAYLDFYVGQLETAICVQSAMASFLAT